MADVNLVLAASKEAVEQLIVAGERSGSDWSAATAPGKWSPSQIVEHVARSLEESANMAAGRPSKFPNLPAIIHPITRALLLRRVLRNQAFPKARTNKAMNPDRGPATPADGRRRLEAAHAVFEQACLDIATRSSMMRTTIFGTVDMVDYVRFTELHTRHHCKQIGPR